MVTRFQGRNGNLCGWCLSKDTQGSHMDISLGDEKLVYDSEVDLLHFSVDFLVLNMVPNHWWLLEVEFRPLASGTDAVNRVNVVQLNGLNRALCLSISSIKFGTNVKSVKFKITRSPSNRFRMENFRKEKILTDLASCDLNQLVQALGRHTAMWLEWL